MMAEVPERSDLEDKMVQGLALAYRTLQFADPNVTATIEPSTVHTAAQLAHDLNVGGMLPSFAQDIVSEKCETYRHATPAKRHELDRSLNSTATSILGAMHTPPSAAKIVQEAQKIEADAKKIPFDQRTLGGHLLAEEHPLDQLALRAGEALNDPRLAATRAALPTKVTGLSGTDVCLALEAAPKTSPLGDLTPFPMFPVPPSSPYIPGDRGLDKEPLPLPGAPYGHTPHRAIPSPLGPLFPEGPLPSPGNRGLDKYQAPLPETPYDGIPNRGAPSPLLPEDVPHLYVPPPPPPIPGIPLGMPKGSREV